MRFGDRVAIITGAAQGLGLAYAKALAREGARVVVVDINAAKVAEAAEQVRKRGGDSIGLGVDVTVPEAVREMVERTVQSFGRIDILINNAAVFSTLQMKPFDEIALEEWDRVLAVQLRGMFLCVRAVAPVMKQQQYGKIVNVSSGTVQVGRTHYLHYVTAKSGVIGFTRSLARELGPWGICVNTLTPGGVKTGVERETMNQRDWELAIQEQSLKRIGVAEDLVGPALFLCSPESDWITGQLLCVDGGRFLY